MSTQSDERHQFSSASNKRPLSIGRMLEHLQTFANGYPIVVAGALCVRGGDALMSIESSSALIAWIRQHADISWRRYGLTKDELFEGLKQIAPRYDWSTASPHFPRLKNVHYTCRWPKATETGALDELVDHFHPATPYDRELIKALILTLYWGGPPGKRPMMVITTRPGTERSRGRGWGKTGLIQLISRLVGGFVSTRSHTNPDRVLTDLLSPRALNARVALIDNLKTYRFSSEFFEALISSTEIDGHRLYHGYASRPNYLTYCVTVNGASFSKDAAERSVVIFLDPRLRKASWLRKTVEFIETNRRSIIADIRWHLKRPPQRLRKPDRWVEWSHEVLSKLENPNELMRQIRLRRQGIDEDDQDAEDALVHLRAWLLTQPGASDPTRSRIWIPSTLASEAIRKWKRNLTDTQARQYLKQLNCPRLAYSRRQGVRGYWWIGEKVNPEAMEIILDYRVRLDA